MPALQRRAALAEERLLGALRQSVPENGRVHLHIIEPLTTWSVCSGSSESSLRTTSSMLVEHLDIPVTRARLGIRREGAKLRKSLFSISISGEFRGTQGNSEETPNLGTFLPILGVIFLHFEGFCLFRGTSGVKRPLCNLPREGRQECPRDIRSENTKRKYT